MNTYVSAVERIYHEVSQPTQIQAQQAQQEVQAISEPTITREDVNAILQYKRSATPEELQFILDHAKEFTLMGWQRDAIALQLSVAIAAKIRQAQAQDTREKHADAFLHKTLKVTETPFGIMQDREWAENLLRQGTQAMWQCKNHRVPKCECWRPVRDALWNVRAAFADKSPESWTALRVWETLEHLETTSRPPGPA